MKYSIDSDFKDLLENGDDLIYFSEFRISRSKDDLNPTSIEPSNINGKFSSIYKNGILNINIQIDPKEYFNFDDKEIGGGYFQHMQLYYRINNKSGDKKPGVYLFRSTEVKEKDPPFYWNTLINLPINIVNPNVVLEKDEMTTLLEGSGPKDGELPKFPKEKFRDLWKEVHTSTLNSEHSFINKFGLRTY